MATKRKAKAKASPRKASPQAVISPCLWFDGDAEEAARFYVSIFKKAKVTGITRFPAVGQEIHGRPAGSVMTVEFVLNGVPFTALNGGPLFKFNEAVSLQVLCRTQAEIDYYWEKLREGGDPNAQQCGWLKDKFGLSWQVVPRILPELLGGSDPAKSQRAMKALLKMKKLNIEELKRAYSGE
jgi:predicted 3-demethylubiquinone-9 3-methyltransferase (glyoxalase superfamily)